MARRFAAVLGLVAFAVMMFRSAADGRAEETAIGDAVCAMFVFAIVGAIAGRIAEMIVTEAAGSKSSSRQSM
jgi:NADH:ubiquinone oxidoreductase subunit 6 (subunit J)